MNRELLEARLKKIGKEAPDPNAMTFYLSDRELKDIANFKKKHRNCLGRTSNNFTYSFCRSSGIGSEVWIECCSCRERKNVTDVESW